MDRLHEPKSDALRALYWRDEILQLMFWIRGEGFGEAIDPALLERFLGVEAEVGIRYLDHLDDCFRLGGCGISGRRRPGSACRAHRSPNSTRSPRPERASVARPGQPRRPGCGRRGVPAQAGL